MSYHDLPHVLRTRSVTPMTSDMSKMLPYVTDKTISKHLGPIGKSLDLGHARTYFNPARNTLYSRYTPQDWQMSNQANFNISDRERSFAEKLRADAVRTVKETDARTRNRQTNVTKKLGERVYDIAFWKNELNNEINAMACEVDNLKEHKRILERAYQDTANPLAIAEECLMHREKRHGIDLVNDEVEKNLIKEVDIIKRCQYKMKKLLEKSTIQLKMDRAGQHALEIDSKDKNHAQNLDDRMHQLRNTSAGIGYYDGAEYQDNTVTIPYSWVKYTQANIARSQKERSSSERLRGEIDQCLRMCANEMWSQFSSVNNQLLTRIRETTDARNRLQNHLQRTMHEIYDMDNMIRTLRKAIQDKEGPMKVAQTRLDERSRRINVELCNDPVMKTLQREVHEIRESVKQLKDNLRSSEISLSRLMKTKATLEHDISVKENSISIDSKNCLGMRKSFPMDAKANTMAIMPVG